MNGWSIVPGIALIAASFVIQFGSYLRRSRRFGWVLLAIRLRFIGFGAFLLGVGANLVISALLTGLVVSSLLAGLFVIALAGTWFYAASDRIFRSVVGSWPPVLSPDRSDDDQ